jgi:hypothetical protein
MRKSLWFIFVVLFVTIGTPHAQADSVTDYKITFTCTIPPGPDCLSPTSGSFEYDNTKNQFTSFQVVFDGLTFDLTVGANNPAGLGTAPCTGTATGPQAALAIMTTCATDPATNWTGVVITGDQVFFRFLNFTDNNNFIEIFDGMDPSLVPIGTPDNASNGTFTTSITTHIATPEPGSDVLVLAGMGLVLVMRKRIAQGH